MVSTVWNKVERKAWELQEFMLPSVWAEENRILDRSNIPGPYRNENAPYLRGVMDLAVALGVEQINVKKAAQMGISEAARNLIAYFAARDPDPLGLTLPNKEKGKKIVRLNIIPLFSKTAVLAELIDSFARDTSVEMINLSNGFMLELMWSGSATSTASTPFRRVFNDEVDKFELWAGDEPDPVGRTWKRMRTYGERRLQMNISTPTTTEGSIHKLVESSSVKLFYYVPCPYCGKCQMLLFGRMKWKDYKASTKAKLAALVLEKEGVWYECVECGKRIVESQKAVMMNKGYWTTEEGYVIDYWGTKYEDAEDVKRWPTGTRIGLQISSLYCLWEKWTDVVAEFLRADGHLDRSIEFRTETLGEPFEFQQARVRRGLFSEKVRRGRLDAGIVPAWAWCIITTIDTQKDHFYVVCRAWGSGMKSQRIYHGILRNFNDLDNLIYRSQWVVEGGKYPKMLTALALIDSGGTEDKMLGMTRTMQVYEWAIPRQAVVKAMKGASRPGDSLYWAMKNPVPKFNSDKKATHIRDELRAYLFDSHKAKDILTDLIIRGIPRKSGRSMAEITGPEIWMLDKTDDDVYNRQMSSMHRTAEKKGKGIVEKWKLVQAGSRCDYHDCETLQIVGAYMYNIHLLPPESEILAKKEAERMDAVREENKRNDARIREVTKTVKKDSFEVEPLAPISF